MNKLKFFLLLFLAFAVFSSVSGLAAQETIIKPIKIIIADKKNLFQEGSLTFVGRLALSGQGCGIGTPNKLINQQVLNLPVDNYYALNFLAYVPREGKEKILYSYSSTFYLNKNASQIIIFIDKDNDNEWSYIVRSPTKLFIKNALIGLNQKISKP